MEGGFFRCLLGSAFVCVCCFLKELCVGQRVLCVLFVLAHSFVKEDRFRNNWAIVGRD